MAVGPPLPPVSAPPPPSSQLPVPPSKEGLTSATEVLKYTLALGTGSLVFGGGLVSDKVALSPVAAGILVLSWLLLGVSVAAGALAYARIPIKLARSYYSLEDKYFTRPGKVHQIAFILGMIALGLALAIALVSKAMHPAASGGDKKDQTPAAIKVLGPPLLIGRVGPFVSGNVIDLEPPPPGEKWLRAEDLLAELRLRSRDGELGYLILVGSADKFELVPALRQQYGSNSGLARLRAESVRQAVEAALGRAVSAVALATGPEVQGARLPSTATRADRSVAVYAAWWQERH